MDYEEIYFMRDNHTFKKLSPDVFSAMLEIEAEFDNGNFYGALVSKREGFSTVDARGPSDKANFLENCQNALQTAQRAVLQIKQITELLRPYGLTIVKVVNGYQIMKFDQANTSQTQISP